MNTKHSFMQNKALNKFKEVTEDSTYNGPRPFPFRGFGIPKKMETPTCQVPRNVLLVVWRLTCNHQKEGETKDPPQSQREEALGPKKKMKTELMTPLELARISLILNTTY